MPTSQHEARFDDPEMPYLLMAGLRARLGDDVLLRAVLVPTEAGPGVTLTPDLAADERVRALVAVLNGTIVGGDPGDTVTPEPAAERQADTALDGRAGSSR